jgi:hypothetical protein
MKVTINEESVEKYPLKARELQNDRFYYAERGVVCLKSGYNVFFLGDGVVNIPVEYCDYWFREAPEGATVTLTQET